ncbi:MAG TPA: hypothetical protein VF855_05115 [Acidimicrobiales bacterium]
MACWQPRDSFVEAVDALGAWVTVVQPSLAQGWLDGDGVKNLASAVGQGSHVVLQGYEYADCLDSDGRSHEAEALRTHLDHLQRELAELFELCR